MYPNRRFVIFDVSELNKINFDEVLETSADTVRKSLDETKTFVKFDITVTIDEEGGEVVNIPPSVESLTTKSQLYLYDEFLVILAGPDWTDPNPIEE